MSASMSSTDRACWAPGPKTPVARLQQASITSRALNFEDIPVERVGGAAGLLELPYVDFVPGQDSGEDEDLRTNSAVTPPRHRRQVRTPNAPARLSVVYVPDEEDALFTPSRRRVPTLPPAPGYPC